MQFSSSSGNHNTHHEDAPLLLGGIHRRSNNNNIRSPQSPPVPRRQTHNSNYHSAFRDTGNSAMSYSQNTPQHLGNGNYSSTTRRRPRDSTDDDAYKYCSPVNNNHHDTTNHPTHSEFADDDSQKDKQHNWSNRMRQVLNQQMQQQAYKVIPPEADETTYEDVYNDAPWKWTFGTTEDDGVWMNTTDRAGFIMAATVWVLLVYSMATMGVLCQSGHLPITLACLYCTIATLALASHAKTCFTDPGAVASSAVPLVTKGVKFHAMCSLCQSYKPTTAHHSRICNRCITRMDHHCPWMNNCVGAGNLKHFTLFLVYTWIASGLALGIFLANYFFCENEHCQFRTLEIQLVRAMSVIGLSAWMFTSSMLMSVLYGMLTGVGTIDRLKKKASNTWHLSDEEPIPWPDVFGSGPWYTWVVPTDPFFPDYDRVMGYATTQRLLREQTMDNEKRRHYLDHRNQENV